MIVNRALLPEPTTDSSATTNSPGPANPAGVGGFSDVVPSDGFDIVGDGVLSAVGGGPDVEVAVVSTVGRAVDVGLPDRVLSEHPTSIIALTTPMPIAHRHREPDWRDCMRNISRVQKSCLPVDLSRSRASSNIADQDERRGCCGDHRRARLGSLVQEVAAAFTCMACRPSANGGHNRGVARTWFPRFGADSFALP